MLCRKCGNSILFVESGVNVTDATDGEYMFIIKACKPKEDYYAVVTNITVGNSTDTDDLNLVCARCGNAGEPDDFED